MVCVSALVGFSGSIAWQLYRFSAAEVVVGASMYMSLRWNVCLDERNENCTCTYLRAAATHHSQTRIFPARNHVGFTMRLDCKVHHG
jgi:hypothetical protein